MNKKYIELVIDNKVICVCPIKECTPLEFAQKKKEAEANLKELLDGINELKKEVKILKGED